MSTQISAYISDSTKQQFDAYVKRRGIKKGFLLEEALLHHLQALKSIPEDLVIPTALIVSKDAMKQLADIIKSPPEATEALRNLMND